MFSGAAKADRPRACELAGEIHADNPLTQLPAISDADGNRELAPCNVRKL
jgi:hypothetical protein